MNKTYKSEDCYNYSQSSLWIFEIFKDIRKRKEGKRLFYKNRWFEFHPFMWGGKLELDEAGYFDERPMLVFQLTSLLAIPSMTAFILTGSVYWILLSILFLNIGMGTIYLHLPFKTGIEECEGGRSWGFYYFMNEGFEDINLILKWGNKSKYIYFPWNLEWYRTSILLKDHSWEHEKKGNRKEFWNKKWKPVLWEESYPYTYILKSGKIQERTATIHLKQWEWRRKWLMWTKLFNRVSTSIEIQFNDEVGERSGSWKGGCLGCSYDLKKNETPEQCLRRMERERKF